MAPRARVAVYKALWSTVDGATASGFTSDLVAAIDQAVADGVDVINYSISGTTTNFLDAAEVAFLFAADAGVFVSTSAGNSGPTTATVAHPSPWITTVAAGTHNRTGVGSVALGDGTVLEGASLATAVPSSPLVDSTAAGLPGASATAVALCFSAASNSGTPALDPAKVAGKIVLCDRGTNALVDKSLAVKDAGGVGMILVNVTPNVLNAVLHSVPTVHLADTARAAVKAYAADPAATASIQRATIVFDVPAPFTAAFSSRGPLRAGSGDLLKPDVIAPGQDILAAVAPPGNSGLSFSVYSGTSMSAPHVAGLAALLKQLHEDWTHDDQVGADDDGHRRDRWRHPRAKRQPGAHLSPGRRPCIAQHGRRSRPRLRFRHQRLVCIPVRRHLRDWHSDLQWPGRSRPFARSE
jgi:subtilisin family serine protease